MGCNVWDNKRKIKEKNLVLFYVYECFVRCVFICAMCVPISWFPGIIYKMLCAAMWGLNTELVLSERASRPFNHWVKFCSLQTVHIYTFKKYSLRLPYKFWSYLITFPPPRFPSSSFPNIFFEKFSVLFVASGISPYTLLSPFTIPVQTFLFYYFVFNTL